MGAVVHGSIHSTSPFRAGKFDFFRGVHSDDSAYAPVLTPFERHRRPQSSYEPPYGWLGFARRRQAIAARRLYAPS